MSKRREMSKSEQSIKRSEEFIQRVLRENFRQEVDPEKLRAAAEKLCDAIPEKEAA